MDDIKRAAMNQKARRKHTIIISLVGPVALCGLILMIYSLTRAEFIFAIWYLIAFILGLAFVVIRINAVFPTYIQADSETITMSVWENGVMPYRVPEKPGFFSDFIPDKVIIKEIPTKEVKRIFVGSKRHLDRNLEAEKIPEILVRLSEDKHFTNTVKRMDFILIEAKDGEICFMPITDFDTADLSAVIDEIEKNSNGVTVSTNISKLIRLREKRI